jgi:hypothetical protein
LTPTGSLPSARWRWWAVITAATPVALALVVPVVPGRLDLQLLLTSSPFSDQALGGVVLVATRVALAVTALAVAVVAASSLVVRFRRAHGVERQQLRWVALAAALMVLAGPVVLVPVVLGIPILVDWVAVVWVAVLPVAVGAAILRYRLYDLDRIISRTVAYGLLTLLLGGGYALVVLGLGQLLGRNSPLVVAGATLAVAAVFQPARRRVQAVVDRRFNRRRHDTTRIIEGSGPACATRSTSTPSRLSCWRWSTRPCSPPRCRCGFDLPHLAPPTRLPVRPGRLPGPTEHHRRPAPPGCGNRQDTAATDH